MRDAAWTGGPPVGGESERWWQEHRELDLLVAELIQAMLSKCIESARSAVDELALAMDAHFSVEEGVYFPLVEDTCRGHDPVIEEARRCHVDLRGRLREVRSHLDGERLRPARRALLELLKRLRGHERDESRLITALAAHVARS